MPSRTLQPTQKGELPHLISGKRTATPIRMTPAEHQELKTTAEAESRSMAFIAYRRYQAGLDLEQSHQ